MTLPAHLDPAPGQGRHLDIGCGARPRNPYGRPQLHGVDIAAPEGSITVVYRQCNFSTGPLPYGDRQFESVSAYDVLEHVPRVLPTPDGTSTRMPFLELMNEVWRVLVPGGLFYAQTPAYPHASAFVDPTHVNIITAQTHEYFARPRLAARPYGYVGDFEVLRSVRVRPSCDYEPWVHGWPERLRRRLRERRGGCSHMIWELRALKPGPADAQVTR